MARDNRFPSHPEDSDDWTDYANNWQVGGQDQGAPERRRRFDLPDDDHAVPPETPHDPAAGQRAPWDPFATSEPGSYEADHKTEYDESSPWTNPTAWRYKENPYRESPEEYRKGCLNIWLVAFLIAGGIIALAFIFGR